MVSIAQERSKLGALGVELRRREQWGARFNYTNSRPVDEPATRVFVHITVTEPGNYSSFDAHARGIEAIGISRFPSTGISYNRLFMAGTRTVYEGQPIGRRGAHTVNDRRRSTCSTSGCPGRGTSITAPSWNLNINARAYVICQNTHHGVPDHMIEDMAMVMAADKLAGFVTKNAEIHGHRCVSSKSCPGDKMWARMVELEKRVNHYLSNGLDGDDMPLTDADVEKIWNHVIPKTTNPEQRLRAEHFLALIHEYVIDARAAVTQALGTTTTTPRQAWQRAELRTESILDAFEGLDTAAIIARIDAHAEESSTERAEILDLIASMQAGDLTATQVVELIGEKLSAPTEP